MMRSGLWGLAFTLVCGCANAGAPAQPDSPPGVATDAAPVKPPEMGHETHGFVAGGVVAKSSSYRLVGTLTSGRGTTKSANYIEHGGVLGSTQK